MTRAPEDGPPAEDPPDDGEPLGEESRRPVLGPFALRVDEGYLFLGLSDLALQSLKGVPMLLESTDERVRKRLLPETCDDPEDEAHWREHATPELERLFMSRSQLVQRDLDKMTSSPEFGGGVLLIPDAHSSAWLAALNAARLALFALNDLEAHHMTDEGMVGLKPKQIEALQRIDFLAMIQSVLLGDFEPEDSGSVDDYDLD